MDTKESIKHILAIGKQLREKDARIKELRAQLNRAWDKIERLEELLERVRNK